MNRHQLLDLLSAHAELRPLALCPEIVAYQAASLVPLWEAVERLEGSEVEPPFWAFAWPGGQAIARHLLDHPVVARGKTVLDLGCGNGIAAIAARKAGALRAVANDVDPAALSMAGLNAAANGLEVELRLEDLLDDPAAARGYDLILAGDMFYSRPLARRAEEWLRAASAGGIAVLAGDPGRTYSPARGVEVIARYQVPVSLDVESSRVLEARLLHFEKD